MKKILLIILTTIVIIFAGCTNSSVREDGIYAAFYTNMGTIICKLFYEKVPITVGNFVGLAEGTRTFTDAETNEEVKRSFYDGLIFHRVVQDFVIQGGCPLGTGMGSPGYRFVDEFDEELKHDSAGILSMANSGIPNTNGSQFFITLNPLPELDGRYTVFGRVVSDMDVLYKIGNVRVDKDDRPYKGIFIKKIKIIRKGEEAKAFDAETAFAKNGEVLKRIEEGKEIKMKEFLESIGVEEDKIVTTNIGLKYYLRKEGNGKIPSKGDTIVAHYTGYLTDGTKFDSSLDRNKPFETEIGVGRVIKGWDEAFLTMKEGEKRVLILPYYLAYGENGYPPVIPPKATLIFEVELISVKRK